MKKINVTLAFDNDAMVWWVQECDVQGVSLEADTIDALINRLPGAILDVWEASADSLDLETPVELITHTSRVMRQGRLAA